MSQSIFLIDTGENVKKMNASIFGSTLSHTGRLDASEKKRRKYSRPILNVFACGQVSSPRLYRLNYKLSLLLRKINLDTSA